MDRRDRIIQTSFLPKKEGRTPFHAENQKLNGITPCRKFYMNLIETSSH